MSFRGVISHLVDFQAALPLGSETASREFTGKRLLCRMPKNVGAEFILKLCTEVALVALVAFLFA